MIDQETARIRADTASGVVAPDFILDNAIAQIARTRATSPAQQKMVLSIARRTAALHLAGDWSSRAVASVTNSVFPALDRQLAALREARSRANADAGVWKLKNGEAYYAWLLSVGTTTRLTAAEIHQIGLDQDRELEGRMDVILRGQGLTKGTVAERTQALTRDPKNLFADSDAGRDELLAYLNQLIADTRPRLSRISKLGLKAPVIVKRVPVDIQDGAAQGYMNFGSLDGSRPSIYYINLKSMENWPRFQLPTLTAHETIPGSRLAGCVHRRTSRSDSAHQLHHGFQTASSRAGRYTPSSLTTSLVPMTTIRWPSSATCKRSASVLDGWWSTQASTRHTGRASMQ